MRNSEIIKARIAELEGDLKKAQDTKMTGAVIKDLEAQLARSKATLAETEAEEAKKTEQHTRKLEVRQKILTDTLQPVLAALIAVLGKDPRYTIEQKEQDDNLGYIVGVSAADLDSSHHLAGIDMSTYYITSSGAGWHSHTHSVPNVEVNPGSYGEGYRKSRYTKLGDVEKVVKKIMDKLEQLYNHYANKERIAKVAAEKKTGLAKLSRGLFGPTANIESDSILIGIGSRYGSGIYDRGYRIQFKSSVLSSRGGGIYWPMLHVSDLDAENQLVNVRLMARMTAEQAKQVVEFATSLLGAIETKES